MVHYDPFAYDTHENPYPIYRQLRDEAPAYYNTQLDFWALSRYEDVRNALIDHDTFCSGQGFLLEDIGELTLPMVLGMDPPDHTRVRGTISRAMTPRRVAALEAPIRRLARDLLAAFAPSGHGDMIADFAAILPMSIISELLGVPHADRNDLRGWADDMVEREDGVKGLPPTARAAGGKIVAYFDDLLQHRAAAPGDDLLSLLMAAEQRGDVSHLELLGFCFLLIIAGNETTAKLIGNMTHQLGLHPEQRQRLIAQPSLIPNAVEEVLRYESSTHMMARTLTRDLELHGRTLPKGKKVALILASANRDDRYWANPDSFDVGRDTTGTLALGLGIHHCLGASLARLEGTVALQEILACIPDFAVDDSGLERVHSGNVRGFSRLPITFTPPSRRGDGQRPR
jgi:cytochrome P450